MFSLAIKKEQAKSDKKTFAEKNEQEKKLLTSPIKKDKKYSIKWTNLIYTNKQLTKKKNGLLLCNVKSWYPHSLGFKNKMKNN